MNSEGGYTYLTTLIVVFATALSAQATWIPQSTISLREAEEELLFRGEAYRSAISSYYHSDPENPSLPDELDDLLADSRFTMRRHIRELYLDPIGDSEWSVIYGSGGITGVVSGGSGHPLKQSGFSELQSGFAGSESYSGWRFEFSVPE